MRMEVESERENEGRGGIKDGRRENETVRVKGNMRGKKEESEGRTRRKGIMVRGVDERGGKGGRE